MKITTKGTNLSLTPEVTDYLEKKLHNIEKFVDPSLDSVTMDIEIGRTTRHHQSGDIFRAEINLHLPGKSFRSEAEEPDIFTAIDRVKDRILEELRGEKTKRLHFIKRSGRIIKEFLRRFYRR